MIYVDEIKNGTVIDHISAGKGKKVLDILGLGNDEIYKLALVMNVNSKRLDKKDMLKISEVYLTDEQVNKIALVSPNATINIIKKSKVAHKHIVTLPNNLIKVAKCPNVNCITNFEIASETNFNLNEKHYKCFYCEKAFKPTELIM